MYYYIFLIESWYGKSVHGHEFPLIDKMILENQKEFYEFREHQAGARTYRVWDNDTGAQPGLMVDANFGYRMYPLLSLRDNLVENRQAWKVIYPPPGSPRAVKGSTWDEVDSMIGRRS